MLGAIGDHDFIDPFLRTDQCLEAHAAFVRRDAQTLAGAGEIVFKAGEKITPRRANQAGKDGLFGYFVGQVMKKTGGRANPVITTDLLKKRLGR